MIIQGENISIVWHKLFSFSLLTWLFPIGLLLRSFLLDCWERFHQPPKPGHCDDECVNWTQSFSFHQMTKSKTSLIKKIHNWGWWYRHWEGTEMQGSSKDLAKRPVSAICATLGKERVKRNQHHLWGAYFTFQGEQPALETQSQTISALREE